MTRGPDPTQPGLRTREDAERGRAALPQCPGLGQVPASGGDTRHGEWGARVYAVTGAGLEEAWNTGGWAAVILPPKSLSVLSHSSCVTNHPEMSKLEQRPNQPVSFLWVRGRGSVWLGGSSTECLGKLQGYTQQRLQNGGWRAGETAHSVNRLHPKHKDLNRILRSI